MVEIEESVPGWQPGAVSYPPPIYKTLGFLREKLALYENEVRITMDLQQTDTAVAGLLIPVALRLQACDDSICLPPERRVLQVPARAPR